MENTETTKPVIIKINEKAASIIIAINQQIEYLEKTRHTVIKGIGLALDVDLDTMVFDLKQNSFIEKVKL